MSLTPKRARCARVIRKAISENFAMTPYEESELATAVEKGLNEEQTHSSNHLDTQDQIHEDIYDALKTVEMFELNNQIGAEDKLDGIAVIASALSTALNDLCNCLHIREPEVGSVAWITKNSSAAKDKGGAS